MESCGRPAAASKKGGRCNTAAAGHGPTLRRGWFPKPRHLVCKLVTGASVPSSRPSMLPAIPPLQALLVSRLWRTDTTTVSTGIGSAVTVQLWEERHHRLVCCRHRRGRRQRIASGFPIDETLGRRGHPSLRWRCRRHGPLVGAKRVHHHEPMVFQVKKTCLVYTIQLYQRVI